ncbi:MAG: hypothetical protein ACR2JH_04915 [Solirubrobacteraceae bacterium]
MLALDAASGDLVLSGRELDYRDGATTSYGPPGLANADTNVVAIHSPAR